MELRPDPSQPTTPPPPLLSPSPALALPYLDSTTPSLSLEINAQTRQLHHTLNRLIIARLPLAIPPHATSPLPFEIGLIAFASLYTNAEAAFAALRASYNPHNGQQAADLHFRLHQLLPSGLERGESLTANLRNLRRLRPHIPFIDEAWVRDVSAREQRETPHPPRPRLGALDRADPGFWGGWRRGFSFLFFDQRVDADDAGDGEELKGIFKRKFVLAEEMLTSQERSEVVEEARLLFEECIELLAQVDGKVAEAVALGLVEPPDAGVKSMGALKGGAMELEGREERLAPFDAKRELYDWEKWKWLVLALMLGFVCWKVLRSIWT
ncbi:MAG: heme oxygenase [Chrysothrix sp. TS-e1954]|nr:MAG: heme oxygenase [Chrysothrix sp. TS-e1954]